MNPEIHPKKSKKILQILEAARNLFLSHGIKRVTVEEICRKAEVSKMTFYKYFPNKEELFRHVWEGWINEGCEKLDEIDTLDIPLPDKIQMMFEWKSNFLSQINGSLVEDMIHLNLGYEKAISHFMKFIINAQNSGEIRPDIKPEFLMTVLDKLYELANDEKLRSRYPTLMEFNREVKDFFWYGVIVRKDFRSE